MSVPGVSGWAFVAGDATDGNDPPGLAVAHTGGIALVSGPAAVRQSILLLLSTAPGERVMRPDYGCDLRRLMFSPNDGTTAGLAIHYVRQAIARFEPRVKVVSLDGEPSPEDPGRLVLVLEYCLRASLERATLVFEVDLSGGAS